MLIQSLTAYSSLCRVLEKTGESGECEITLKYFIGYDESKPSIFGEAPTGIIQLIKHDGRVVALCARGNVVIYEQESEKTSDKMIVRLPTDAPLRIIRRNNTMGVISVSGRVYRIDLGEKVPSVALTGQIHQQEDEETSFTVALERDDVLILGTESGSIYVCRDIPLDSVSVSRKRDRAGTAQTALPSAGILQCIKKAHEGSISSLAIIPEKFAVLSGSFDGTIRMWDYIDGTKLIGFDTSAPISCMGLKPQSGAAEETSMLCTGHVDGKVRVWEFTESTDGESQRSLKLKTTVNCHKRLITQVAWNPLDNQILASVSNDSKVAIVDSATQRIPLSQSIVPDLATNSKKEFPISGTCALWTQSRTLLVGTNQNTVLRYEY